MIQYLRKLADLDHQITFISPQDDEFINSKVAGQWYLPQLLVSREVDYIINQFNFFLHVIRARSDPIFEKTGRFGSSNYFHLSTRW
jgi:hypothetical protein